nr:Lysophospholipid transporter LplT [Candidatus Pantoea persica]
MLRRFFSACSQLWHNAETRFSLLGTSLFWGAGAPAVGIGFGALFVLAIAVLWVWRPKAAAR